MVERPYRLYRPGPRIQQEIEYIKKRLRDSEIELQQDGAYFKKTGESVLRDKYADLELDGRLFIWTEELLGQDPERCRIKSLGEEGILLDRGGRKNGRKRFHRIIPKEIMRVEGNTHSSPYLVRKSGYLLEDRYYQIGDKRQLTTDEVEQFLIDIDEGIKPPGFTYETYVRVDPILAGKELFLITFQPDLGKEHWDKDAVVIDPESFRLVGREVFRPFAREQSG